MKVDASRGLARDGKPKLLHITFLASLVFVVGATIVRLPFEAFLQGTAPFIFYYPAVMLAAWYGGLFAGVLATILGVLAAIYFFIEPRFSLFGMTPPFWVTCIIFVTAGLFISFLSELRFRAMERERQLKQLLEKQKSFVEEILTSIDDAFCVIGSDWRLVYVNGPAARLAGRTREDMKGQPFWEMFPHQEAFDKPHLEHAMRDRVPVRFETRLHQSGLWISVGAFPCENGITVYAIDVTERKKLEPELERGRDLLKKQAADLEAEVQRRTSQLQETIAQLESFSYTVSHDLRSPLRAMQAYAHLTLDEAGAALPQTSREYLKRIDEAAQRMDRLIQDVITYNKVTRAEIRLQPIDTEQMLHEVIRQYPPLESFSGSIEVQRPMDPVMADPGALVQAVAHLLGNALKFVQPGEKPHVKISSARLDGKVSLCIEDKGIGIDPASLNKIFEPFHRAHPHAGYEGTGIGLAVARKAIERMGGSLQAESAVGKGSKFRILLKSA